MPDSNKLLSEIWSYFNKAGIADDLTIIEHIAALLTRGHEAADKDLYPRMPLNEDLPISDIQLKLEMAIEEAKGKATLFNQFVLFRLDERLPGGRYPTPRHIVMCMQQLAQIRTKDRLADFCCGSGGFLISPAERVTGIDISPEWSRLAWANRVLHGDSQPNITIGNALREYASGAIHDQVFDRILMNPPFGEKLDSTLTRSVVGREYGTHSETVLAALALKALADSGIAVILVSPGMLYRPDMRSFRELLVGTLDNQGNIVGNYDLDAVISLPRDALQPYSPIQAHIIIVSKVGQQSRRHSSTWFFQAEFDGYPAGRARDLTQSPESPNDLTFVERFLLTSNTEFDADQKFPQSGQALIGVKRLDPGTAIYSRCIVIESLNDTVISLIEFFPAREGKTPSFLLIQVVAADNQRTRSFRFVPSESKVTEVLATKEDFLKTLYKPTKDDPIPSAKEIFRDGGRRQAIALVDENRFVGVTLSRDRLIKQGYELRPDQYVRAQHVQEGSETPAVLLGRIRGKQQDFLQRIDGLLGRLELNPAAKQELPSPPLGVVPFEGLSQDQEEVWKKNYQGK